MMSLRPLVEGKWLTVWVCYNRRVRRSVRSRGFLDCLIFSWNKNPSEHYWGGFFTGHFWGWNSFPSLNHLDPHFLGVKPGYNIPWSHTPARLNVENLPVFFLDPKRLGREESSSPPGLSKLQLLRKRLDDTMRAAEGGVLWFFRDEFHRVWLFNNGNYTGASYIGLIFQNPPNTFWEGVWPTP